MTGVYSNLETIMRMREGQRTTYMARQYMHHTHIHTNTHTHTHTYTHKLDASQLQKVTLFTPLDKIQLDRIINFSSF